jgi:hypothetical protein
LSATQTSSASHLCQVVSPYFCPRSRGHCMQKILFFMQWQNH